MSITGDLLAFGVRSLFKVSADELIGLIEERFTDHSQALPRALAKANDRAWQAVGLALVGDNLFDRVLDVFRDADLKGVRNQIKKFLDHTPTGLENATSRKRDNAAKEWSRLHQAGQFSMSTISPTDLARRARTLDRHGDPARLTAAAHHAVRQTAEALRNEAPYLAELLTAAPDGGTPLLAAAFAFFFRRELETNPELHRGLSFDYLNQISERQEQGLDLLDLRTASIADQVAVLFDALGNWFADQGSKLDDINAKLDHIIRLRDVPTSTSEPLRVSVTNKAELELLQSLRNQLRNLPPEVVAAADWSKLGDTLAAAGMSSQAGEAHEAAASAAHAVANRQAEAEAKYKVFRDACETGGGAAALAAFHRAVELDPQRFAPFDLQRYKAAGVLGIGGFGTVFLATDEYVRVGKERQPQRVAIKSIHDSGLDALLERDLSETFDEADTLSALNHPGIVKTLNRGFGDPHRRKRPYIVLEYFPGVTLQTWLKTKGPLPLQHVLRIARQIAKAVHAAHQVGVLHRDIKPANVMIYQNPQTQRWQVKVIDFGLAVKVHVARSSMNVPAGYRTALDRSLAGTLRYAPPEQRNELNAEVGPYSDVYAWGKTCFDLLFGTTEPKALHWKTLPDQYRDRVQALLEQATLDSIVHTNPDHQRFRSFEEVLVKLAEVVSGAAEMPDAADSGKNLLDTPPPLSDQVAEPKTDKKSIPISAHDQKRSENPAVQSKTDKKPIPIPTKVVAIPDIPVAIPEIPVAKGDLHFLEELHHDVVVPVPEIPAAKGPLIQEHQFGEAIQAKSLAFAPGSKPGIILSLIWDAVPPKSIFSKLQEWVVHKEERENIAEMKFAWIPHGTFLMGGNGQDDNPQRSVTISMGFWMGIYPVTQAQWHAVMGYNPSSFQGKNRPVERVSWFESNKFCEKMKQLTGKAIRLPTEAEWEYACRATTSSEYCNGDSVESLKKVGWYNGNENSQSSTHPVGKLAANLWGLHDVHGNVLEWCQDVYGVLYTGNQTDPRVQTYGAVRVLRGGSWLNNHLRCFAASRFSFEPSDRYANFGLRVCFHPD